MHDDRSFFREQLTRAKNLLNNRPADSRIRAAISPEWLVTAETLIEKTLDSGLPFLHHRPLLGFLMSASENELDELDADIQLVINQTRGDRVGSTCSFLKAAPGDARHWYSGLLEIWCKSTLIRHGLTTEFDVPVTSGRDHDIAVVVNGKRFHLECTALTESDEDLETWDRFLKVKAVDKDAVLTRPGPFCSNDSKGPSLYYDCLRVYGKVFDKIAKDLNANQSQFDTGEPNLLLLSFTGIWLSPDNPGVGWALDELFLSHPRSAKNKISTDSNIPDVSLEAWVTFKANDLYRAGKITDDEFCDRLNRIYDAPRLLGAIMGFRKLKHVNGRVNYNALAQCQLTHSEMADFERLFSGKPIYCAY